MNKTTKKAVSAFLCAAALFASTEAYAAESKTYTFTLEQAIDAAMTDNPQLEACDAEQKSNQYNLSAAMNTKSKYKKMPVYASSYDTMYIKEGYYVDMYKTLMELNTKKREQISSSVAFGVTQSYYQYKIANSLCDVAKKAYDLAQENFENVNKRFELGMIAQLDLDNASLSVSNCESTLRDYERQRDIARENLKIKLQLDGQECDFVLTDGIECDEFAADADSDIAKAMDTRYDVASLKANYELAQKYFDYTKPLTPGSAKYQTAYSDLVSKEYGYTNNKKLIALSVRSTYNSVLAAADSLDNARCSADIAKRTYDINKVKFDNGMITNSDLTTSLNNYLNAETALENAKLTYKLAYEKYGYEISIGLQQ